MRLQIIFLLTALFSLSHIGFADDNVARAKFNDAKTIYADRATPARLDAAIAALAAAETEAQDKDLKYDVLIFSARAFYFKAVHTNVDATKKAHFETGLAKAIAAKAVSADWVESDYWHAANLARLAEIMAPIDPVGSMKRKQELLDTLETVMDPDSKTHDGRPGEAFESYGGNRILGRLYFKLPPLAGGSQAKSLKYLEVAYDKGRENSLNVLYYAQTLAAGSGNVDLDKRNKQEARRILDELLRNDERTYNLNRIPETIEEFAEARTLRRQLGD